MCGISHNYNPWRLTPPPPSGREPWLKSDRRRFDLAWGGGGGGTCCLQAYLHYTPCDMPVTLCTVQVAMTLPRNITYTIGPPISVFISVSLAAVSSGRAYHISLHLMYVRNVTSIPSHSLVLTFRSFFLLTLVFLTFSYVKDATLFCFSS